VVLDLAGTTSPGPPIDASTSPPVDLSTGGAPPDLAVSSITYTATVIAGHSHDITLMVALFASPPADGISQPTSVTLNHNHTVTLTQAQLASIGGGAAVTVDTSVTDSHLHTFTFTNSG
jgi:hypothetical protein